MSQPLPTQEILAIDLHSNQWRFRHIYRGNNSFYYIIQTQRLR